MKKLFGFAALAAVAAGCVSYPEQVEQREYKQDAKVVAEPTAKPYVEGATLRPLRVLVSMDGGKDVKSDAYAFSQRIQSNVEGALAARGYRIVYDRPAEILVSTIEQVTCQLLNKRGSRVVYKADADVQVTRGPLVNKVKGGAANQTMKDVVARQRFDAQGKESRDETDGIKSVADTLGPQLSEWVGQSVTRIAGTLERCEFTIRNAWNYRGEEEYPSRLVATINRIKGVYKCVVLSTDNVTRSVRIEVIYDKDMFPEGLVNSLYTVRELNLYR